MSSPRIQAIIQAAPVQVGLEGAPIRIEMKAPQGPAGPTGPTGPPGTTEWNGLTGTVDIVPFTTTNGGPTATGELAWLASTESLALRLANGENLDIGEENVYHVENNTGSTIAKGTAVSYAGTVGGSGKIRVKPWNGSTDATEAFMGFAMGAIPAGEAGYVTAFGVIRGVNTSAFSDGVILYANPSGTGLTATKPTTTHVIACLCVNASNNGTILVRPTVDKITGWDDVTGKPTEFTPAPHTHGNITNDGRIGTTADLVTVTGAGGVLTTASRSGIDSRTSFPNADVAAATNDSIAGTIVKRSVDNVVALNTVELSGFGGIIGVGNNVQISLQAANSIIETQFGNSPIQTLDPTSNIITRGSFVLNGGANTITLSGAPTANRTITVPDASGTLALISTAGQNFLNSPTSANLATLLTDENGTGGGFVRAEGATLTSPTLTGEVTANIGDGRLIINKASSINTREGLLQCKISDAGNDTFQISNGTAANGRFIPTFSGYIDSTNSRESLDFIGLVSTGNDASNSSAAGIVNIFAARTSVSTDPVSGTFTSIQNRNIFSIAHNAVYSTESDFALIVKPNGVVVFPSSGNVGIGTSSPNSSSVLDLASTTRGFLPPRMTTAQRNAIASVPAGLMIYNTSTNKLNFYNGTAWEAVTSA